MAKLGALLFAPASRQRSNSEDTETYGDADVSIEAPGLGNDPTARILKHGYTRGGWRLSCV